MPQLGLGALPEAPASLRARDTWLARPPKMPQSCKEFSLLRLLLLQSSVCLNLESVPFALLVPLSSLVQFR